MGIEIEGLRGLNDSLDETIQGIVTGVEKAREQEIQELANDIADEAPVDTGELRDSVRAEEDGVHITAEHAEAVELEQPYVLPVIERNRGRYLEKAKKEIEKELPGG